MSLNEKQIEKLNIKEELKEEKKNLEKQLELMRKSLDMGDDYGSAWEEEETDESEEISNYVGAKAMLENRLGNIEEALDKIEEGTYGECEECGGDIQIDILRVAPESTLCIDCKKKSN